MKTNEIQIYAGDLSPNSIDKMSAFISDSLQEMSVSGTEILRYRLSVESVMGVWAQELGENTGCQLLKSHRFGKTSLLLQTAGRSVDPTQYRDELLLSVSSNPSLVAALGLAAEYRYTGGRNILKLALPVKKPDITVQVLISMLAAIIFGVIMRRFAPNTGAMLVDNIIAPLMNTVTDILHLISGPLIFISIVSGITSMSDASSFGKIGLRLILRFFVMLAAVNTAAYFAVCYMFPLSKGKELGGVNIFSKIFTMILDIIPADIVTPFQTGNAMQIIFLAVCVGIGCIVIGDTAFETGRILNQINAMIQLFMLKINKLLPAFVFFCISNLVITTNLSELTQILYPLIVIFILETALPLVYGMYASLRSGIPYIKLLKSQFPTYFTAFTTASSAAVFNLNIECCEEKLGIDKKLVMLGVPLGQVLYKPGSASHFMIICLFMAKQYGTAITPVWLITAILVVSILGMAAAPVPGGAFSVISLLLSQLAIPSECMALCAVILVFGDYSITSTNVALLQQELAINARKLGMLKK